MESETSKQTSHESVVIIPDRILKDSNEDENNLKSRSDPPFLEISLAKPKPWYKGKNEVKLVIMMLLILSMMIVELVVGFKSGSLALIGDAFHMASDGISLIIAFIAIQMSKRSRSASNTYGWQRAEVIGSFVNGVFLLSVCLFITLEAIQRFVQIEEVDNPLLVVYVASAGIGVNIIGLFLFWSEGHGHSHGGGGGHGHSHGGGHGHKHKHSKEKHSHGHKQSNGSEEHSHSHSHKHQHSSDEEEKHSHGHKQHKHSGGEEKPSHKHSHDHKQHKHQHSSEEEEKHSHSHGHKQHKHQHSSDEEEKHSHSHGHKQHSDGEEKLSHKHEKKLKSIPEDDSHHSHSEDKEIMEDSHKENDDIYESTDNNKNNEYEEDSHEKEYRSPVWDGISKTLKEEDDEDLEDSVSGAKLKVRNENIQAVFLHVLGDFLGSLAAITSGLLIHFLSFHEKYYFDPILSIVIILIILRSTIPLVQRTLHVLMLKVPTFINVEKLRSELAKVPGVITIHELHVWTLVGNKFIGTVHITCLNNTDFMFIATRLKQIFHRFNVHSTTIQPEFLHTSELQQKREQCKLGCVKKETCKSESCCPPTYDEAMGDDELQNLLQVTKKRKLFKRRKTDFH